MQFVQDSIWIFLNLDLATNLSSLLRVIRGRWRKLAPTATKKKGERKRGLCEVCLRQSAISADVTHAVGVDDFAPATEARACSSHLRLYLQNSARSTPVHAIWRAEYFPLSLSWLWLGALRSCLLMASSGIREWVGIIGLLVVPFHPSLKSLTLPFYCSPVAVPNRIRRRGSTRAIEVRGDDTFKGSRRFADACRHEISTAVEGAGKGTEEHAQISLCLPEASRSGENQGGG